ncbi:hypothetical protein FEM48_Zijuj01G0109000 [Ziziphus jujuba var. spinosa]|uniref:Pentatricopeptide repeat-containing protein At1g30610, chloroplastic n=1 Tax=Ziziphus jujuba var. spinosa TaxID=714518 RepID=A0A978W0V0_ZIZJJ|nr:hypothetical protein FEM48_Zijuj01G0109000 [Ziziphus jujuba var. spinosa]
MVVMIMSNGQMGISNFQRPGILDSGFKPNSFSLSAFSIHWRPTFGVDLNCKNRVLKRGTISKVLSKGGGGSDGVLEKEFEFKPSFDEYLKVMESVRTVKDRNQGIGSKEQKSMKGLKDKVEGNAENTNELVGNIDVFMNGKERQMEVISKLKEGFRSKERKVKKQVGGVTSGKRPSRYQSSGEEAELEDFSSSKSTGNAEKSTRLRDPLQTKYYDMAVQGDKKHGGLKRNWLQEEKITDKVVAPKNGKLTRRNEAFLKRVDDKSSTVEREAFRNFDEYNNIMDQPRVSQMAMEERIQQLAKLLNGADIDMPEWMFSKMMRSAKIRFTDHSILRVIQLLGKLGNWRRVLQVIEWLQMRERFKSHKLSGNVEDLSFYEMGNKLHGASGTSISPKLLSAGAIAQQDIIVSVLSGSGLKLLIKSRIQDEATLFTFIYTTALNVLGKAKRPVEALNVFHAMQQQMSSYPDLVAYHSIAITLGQAGHMKELFDVIDTMQSPPKKKFKKGALEKWDPRLEPDIVVYNAVLNACVQRKQWEGAFWVMQQLKQKGIHPSTTTYGLVMEVMFACGKYNLVHEFFRKVQKSSIPNALTYRVLVNTLWKEGKVDQAVSAVENMEGRGVVGSAALYYDLARCLCGAGRCQEALKQIKKICKVANKPLVVTYTGLVQACLDSGNIQDAEYIFNQMKDFCSPNLVTCNIMLKAYLEHGMFKEAKELFLEMLEDGNHISSKSDYKVRVIPDIYTFNTLLDACTAEKRWDDFEYVFKRMLHHGFHFNAKRHLRMILDASRAGKGELLDMAWIHLTEAARVPPPPLIKERFCLKLEKGDVVAAISCISYHNLGNLQEFSQKAWLKLLKEDSKRFSKDSLIRLIHEISILISGRDCPNPVLDNVLASCKEVCRTGVIVADIKPTETFSRTQIDSDLKFQ